MLLQEPGHSRYDLHFELFRFPVRIAWTFWIVALLFGHGMVQLLDFELRELSPGILPLWLLWCICLFVSILIHELGHALAFRQFGIESRIVLYHLGGLAIPSSSFSPGRGNQRLSPRQDVWVSLAGPLAQFLSAVLVGVIVVAMGYRLSVLNLMPKPFESLAGLLEGKDLAGDSPGLFALVTFYFYPSVLWALFNLVPVWPLDGGHIARSLILIRRGTVVQALWVSVIAAAIMAIYGFSEKQWFIAMLFFVLGIESFQAIKQLEGPRYG